MKTGIIVQARMGSSRLPGKIMMNLAEKPVLWHDIARLRLCREVTNLIVATTDLDQDSVVATWAAINGVDCFRGSEQDVLSRYFLAASQYELDVIVRVTSDCPLIDPHVIDAMVKKHFALGGRFVTNAGDEKHRTFPRGLDAEVFSYSLLQAAYDNASDAYQREHVAPYMYENSNPYYYQNHADYSAHRWTLDTAEDFSLISSIYDELYRGEHDFFLDEILELFGRKPDLFQLNAHVKQKPVT